MKCPRCKTGILEPMSDYVSTGVEGETVFESWLSCDRCGTQYDPDDTELRDEE